jgi:hypothetical protein
MKRIQIKLIIVFLSAFFITISCTDEFLKTPEAELQVFIKNDSNELEIPDSIFANETSLYFANEGVSFFSVVYPGDKEEKEKIVDENGDTLTVWKVNHDYEDINNVNYVDKDGKRAVSGMALSYQDNYSMFLSKSSFKFKEAGNYKIYLESRNTNEKGEVAINTDSKIITVLEKE